MTAAITTNDVLVVRPPRWNFAGYCIMCGQRGCQGSECICDFEATAWAVCDRCDGRGADPASSVRCGCYGGLVEVDTDDPTAVA